MDKALQNPVTVDHRASPLSSVTSTHRTSVSLRDSSVFDDESESHGTPHALILNVLRFIGVMTTQICRLCGDVGQGTMLVRHFGHTMAVFISE